MFCKWCGKKITNNGTPCPSCGKNQDPLENGNGFWDLCNIKPEERPSPDTAADTSAKSSEKAPAPEKAKAPHAPAERKSSAKTGKVGRWIIGILLVVAIVLVGVCICKTSKCMSEIDLLQSSIYNLDDNVEEGFSKLAALQEAPETPSSEAADNRGEIEEDTAIDGEILTEPEKLSIEIYEIETTPAKCVYIAVGEAADNENAKIFWQKSSDQGETWVTVSEDVSYIIANADDTDAYRAICVITDDSDERIIYGTVPPEADDDAEAPADNLTDEAPEQDNSDKEEDSTLTDNSETVG